MQTLKEQLAEAKENGGGGDGGGGMSEEERKGFHEFIGRLEVERDNLKDAVENGDFLKRNLAIMNALLAEKLDRGNDETLNDQTIVELAQGNLEYLKVHKKSLMQRLQELEFEDAEQKDIYDSVFEEIADIAREQGDREKDVEELEEKVEVLEQEVEKRNVEILQLQRQLDQFEATGIDPTATHTPNMGMGDDDDFKYGAGMSVPVGFNVNTQAQQEYLQQLADEENEVWREREERAWKQFLTQVCWR